MHLRTHDQSKFVMSHFNKSLNQWDYTYYPNHFMKLYVCDQLQFMLLFHYFPLPTHCLITTISLLGNRGCPPPTHFLLQDMISKAGDCLFFFFFLASLHRYQCWKEVSWVCHQARSELSHLEYLHLLYTKEQRMLIFSNLRQVAEWYFLLIHNKTGK